eukprot:3191528-Heterocapsa_arctica.AAC.1
MTFRYNATPLYLFRRDKLRPDPIDLRPRRVGKLCEVTLSGGLDSAPFASCEVLPRWGDLLHARC